MAENTSQFAPDVRKCLHWAPCLRQSASGKGIVSDSAGILQPMGRHIPEATMERRGKSCNSCHVIHVSRPSPGTQRKATKLVAALQNCEWQNRAGETCKFEPTYLFLMPGCTSYHKFVQLLHVE